MELKNSLSDLHSLLFEDIELLSNEDLTDEELDRIIRRSNAKCNIANVLVANAKVQFDATKFIIENGLGQSEVPEMLTYAKKRGK